MKNSIIYVLILGLIPHPGPRGQAQRTTLSIIDKSPLGAPLQAVGNAIVTGEITSRGIESTEELTATLKNTSSKPIVAFEAVIDLSPAGVRKINRTDFFFSDSPLMPGSTAEIVFGPHRVIVYWNGAPHSSTFDALSPGQGQAKVRVIFAQFTDNTVFGKSSWAETLTAERVNMKQVMRRLLGAYDADKGTGLKTAIEEELARPKLPDNVSSFLGEIQRRFLETGPAPAVEYLETLLANAERHASSLDMN